jgi:hypothetical protein
MAQTWRGFLFCSKFLSWASSRVAGGDLLGVLIKVIRVFIFSQPINNVVL